MVGFGERILIDLFESNPSEIHRTVESYVTGHMPAGKDFHNNFKMRVNKVKLYLDEHKINIEEIENYGTKKSPAYRWVRRVAWLKVKGRCLRSASGTWE